MLQHHPEYTPKDSCGCGREGALVDLIPDTIYWISIKRSCCIHDDRYQRGGTIEDFNNANYEFLVNMLMEIEAGAKWYTPTIRAKLAALFYYQAVVSYGKDAFNWAK